MDTQDLKILDTLTKDARTNLKNIAEECGLSSSAILSRIENLKETGIIVGTRLNVKHSALDYPYEATVGIAAETQRIEQVALAIRNQPNVIVCTKSIGKYNLLCLVVARNTDDLDKETQKIKNISGVKGIAINIWIDEPYLRNVPDPSPINGEQKVDGIDKEIIRELMDNSRAPCTTIARKLKISNETVRKKIEKMRASGIIRSCSITVDWSKLGYQGTVFIFISQNPGYRKENTINQLKKISSIDLIANVMGTFDILVSVQVKDLRDFAKVVDNIQKITSIGHIDVCFATFTYFSFAPIPRAPIKCDTLELSS